MKNNFDKGPEGWCSYDYHASMVADGSNIFILATWAAQGGVDNGSFIWTDHRRWSADTPERPLSILPLLCYRSWVGADPLDMRQSAVAVHLRADRLRLDGAQCFFWVHAASTRWHYTAHPLALAEGVWTANRLALAADENQWHRSWSADPRPSRRPRTGVEPGRELRFLLRRIFQRSYRQVVNEPIFYHCWDVDGSTMPLDRELYT